MATTYISKTNGTSTNEKIFTFSAWVKRSGVDDNLDNVLMSQYTDDATRMKILFSSDDFLNVFQKDGGSTRTNILTNRKFRDCNSWYHVMVVCDNTQSSTDRVKIYINGVQETSFSSSQYPFSSTIPTINANSKVVTIGTTLNDAGNPGSMFNGSMSHVHYCDGTALAPTVFGSTDSVTGEWQINTSPSFTPGTNGFTILKDGNTITDQSTNSNNWSLTAGTLTKTEDCPSNVFSTWNPLYHDPNNNQTIFENGNTKASTNTDETAHNTGVSNFAMPVGYGKFYAEIKCNYNSATTLGVGVINAERATKTWYRGDNLMNENTTTYVGRVIYSSSGATVTGGGVENQVYGNSYTDGDIIGIACDMENGAVYFSKNGTWQNSGDPTSGASKTGAVDMSAQSWYTGTAFWYFYCGKKNTNNRTYYSANFGNGYFGSTQISSAGTNASGIGIFEYDVPTGYTSLSTKGLNL